MYKAQRILDTKDKPLEIMRDDVLAQAKNCGDNGRNKGAYAYNGDEAWFMPPYPTPNRRMNAPAPVTLFSSTFVAALAMDKTIEEALMMAPRQLNVRRPENRRSRRLAYFAGN